ncbi:hypothetical protein JHN59_08645 [Streptomyces sp. MBT49]|uniref:hypothetical protein n=1 Tax=unclassified Streptomyces TaxID=2593676 RepID=UPI00190C9FAE|nr:MULTISPECIES: hypothetical protein [unclassified Streptomyces]MBK3624915.1 hypothetical protein [Streptomyces sp. MBT49]MBK3632559.1 hypothetical protein [Streptomyces sp. MBT97]
MPLPKAQVLFGDSPEAPALSNAEVSRRFDELMKAIDNTPTRTLDREAVASAFGEGTGITFSSNAPTTAYDALTKSLEGDIGKAIAPETLASVTSALDALKAERPDLMKDLTTSSPIGTGLVAYDLEAPAKMLTPRPTPLRNRIPRRKGIGLSRQFKVISGFTGTATGGVANLHPGIQDTTQTNFAPSGAGNSLYYARGPKITYAGYDKTVAYSQFSVSDQVTWSAQYAGQGYQDIRQLSRTSLLYSSMLLEERMILMGRGTSGRGFLGAVGAPTSLTLTARAAAGSETALSGYSTNIYVKVTSDAGDFGQSVLTAAANVAPSGGQVVDVTVNLPAGATGLRVYVSTGSSDPGDAARWYAGRSGYNTFTLQGALPTSGTPASLVTADTSAYTAGYDGILPICTGPESGYVNRLNAALSTANPGVEFQTAFAALYDAVKADPDRILLNGGDRKQLSDSLKNASSSNYRMTITQDQLTGVTLGDVVTTIINEITGKGVDIEVHPWMPQGNAPIISDTLPLPDSEVSDVWAIYNVQDMLGVDWPVNQFAFESSSYWMGAMLCYAPAWNGAVTGIKKA